MRNSKNEKRAAVALVLMLFLFLSIFSALPAVYARDIETYSFVAVAPNPVGVGQTVTVVMWLDKMPPYSMPSYLPMALWEFTLSVTKPDGTTSVMTPQKSDPVGSAYTYYIPEITGTYYFQMSFSEQIVGTDTYKTSTSMKAELTVQEDEIESFPENPLPSGYWERPINAQNRDWWSISGNYYGVVLVSPGRQNGHSLNYGKFAPYTTGPNTAHIMWTKSITFGGLVGGEFKEIEYYTGHSYENKMVPTIILNGRVYYNVPLSNNPTGNGFACVDIRTGEELWKVTAQ
jgi:hypothetical protein